MATVRVDVLPPRCRVHPLNGDGFPCYDPIGKQWYCAHRQRPTGPICGELLPTPTKSLTRFDPVVIFVDMR